jgi:hypothetical protein
VSPIHGIGVFAVRPISKGVNPLKSYLHFKEIDIDKKDINGRITLEVKQKELSDFSKMLGQLEKFCDYIVSGKKLEVHSNWRKIGSTSTASSDNKDTVFRSSGIAPQSGFQERQVLSDLFVKWVQTGNVFDPFTLPKRNGTK